MPLRRYPLVDVVLGVPSSGPRLGAPALMPHGTLLYVYEDEALTTPLTVYLDEAGEEATTFLTVSGVTIPTFYVDDSFEIVFLEADTGGSFKCLPADLLDVANGILDETRQAQAAAEAVGDSNDTIVAALMPRLSESAIAGQLNSRLGYTTLDEHGAVGDDVADDTVAWVAAQAASKFIWLTAGKTYRIDPQVLNADDVHIRGYGAKVKPTSGSSGVLLTVLGDRCTIEGAEFDGDSATVTQCLKIGDGTGAGAHCTLRRVWVTGTKHAGVYGNGAPNLTVEGGRLYTCGVAAGSNGPGIFASSCADLTLDGVLMDDNYEHGCYILAGVELGTVVRGCRAIGNGVRKPSGGTGLSIRASGATVVGNFAYGNHTGALSLAAPIQSPTTGGARSVVSGNVLGWSTGTTAALDREVYLSHIEESICTGNIMYSALAGYVLRVGVTIADGAEGIVSANQIINDNPAAVGGVRLDTPTHFADNRVVGPGTGGTGVYCNPGTPDLSVLNNRVKGFTNGIYAPVGTCDRLHIEGNDTKGNTSWGVYNLSTGVDQFVSTIGNGLEVYAARFWLAADFQHVGSKVGFFNKTPVTKPTALTAPDASTVDTTYGTEEAAVINNLRTRLNELETKLKSLGLIT